jgi:hypothetical protein
MLMLRIMNLMHHSECGTTGQEKGEQHGAAYQL